MSAPGDVVRRGRRSHLVQVVKKVTPNLPPRYRGTMTDAQAITVRLPGDVYEALRLEAFEKRTSQSAIITEAVAARLGLRPTGDRHEPRMPVTKEEFEMVMTVFQKVLMMVRPEGGDLVQVVKKGRRVPAITWCRALAHLAAGADRWILPARLPSTRGGS